MIGEYTKIRLHASMTLPPPQTEDTVQYSKLDVALLSATSTTSPPPVFSAERSQQMIGEEEPIKKTDVHPPRLAVSSHRAPSQTFILKHLITVGHPHTYIRL